MADCNEKLADKEPKCERCLNDHQGVSKVATFFCSECMDFLCLDCKVDHSKNEILKSHIVLEKEDNLFNTLRDIKRILYCKEHGKLRVYVCEDHSEIICETCTLGNHTDCKTVTKSDKFQQETIGNITRLNDEVQATYIQKLILQIRQRCNAAKQKILLDDLKAFAEKYEEINTKELEEIEEASHVKKEGTREILSKKHDTLTTVSKLNDHTKEQIVANYILMSMREHESCINGLVYMEQEIIREEEFTDKLVLMREISMYTKVNTKLDEGSVCDDMHSMSKSEVTQTGPGMDSNHTAADLDGTNFETLIETEDNEAVLETDIWDVSTYSGEMTGDDQINLSSSGPLPDDIEDRVSMMPQIATVSDTDCQTSIMDYCKPNKPLSQRSIQLSGTYDIRLKNEKTCYVEGIMIKDDDNILVADSMNNKLKLFDRHFHLRSAVSTRGEPISMCRTADDMIAVGCDTKQVHIYSVGKSLHHVSQFKLRYHCRGICKTSTDLIALLLSDIPIRDKDANTIEINSEDDRILIEFRKPTNGQILHVIDQFEGVLETPSFIIQDTRGNFVVGEADQLTAFNKNGDREWFYKGYKKAKLEGTQGMDIDGEGNIYVCGYDSNNIHQVSCMNYKHTRVIIPYVPAPISIAYDSFNDRLIVGCGNSKCLYVYNIM